MTLAQLAASYRQQAQILGSRIQLVRQLPAHTTAEEVARRERLRLLEAMRRDVRDVAVICERYYEKNYRCSERYRI